MVVSIFMSEPVLSGEPSRRTLARLTTEALRARRPPIRHPVNHLARLHFLAVSKRGVKGRKAVPFDTIVQAVTDATNSDSEEDARPSRVDSTVGERCDKENEPGFLRTHSHGVAHKKIACRSMRRHT